MQSARLQQLREWSTAASQPGYAAVPQATDRASAFQQGVHSLVYELLMTKVGRRMPTATTGATTTLIRVGACHALQTLLELPAHC